MQNRLSKPKVKLSEIAKVMAGQSSADPVLVVNSIEGPTIRCELRCLAAHREVSSPVANYESFMLIIEGKGKGTLKESNRPEKDYGLGKDDFLFAPFGSSCCLANDQSQPLLYVLVRGVLLNGAPVDERSRELYGPAYVTQDGSQTLRLIKAGEREIYRHGHRTHGHEAAPASIGTSVQRGVQYPNCGSRTVAAARSRLEPTRPKVPHWQNFDEVRYIISGELIDHQGPKESEEEVIQAEAGDFIYIPSRVRHYQTSSKGCESACLWGITLATWCPDMEDGKFGNYHPSSFIYREGD